MGRKNFLSGILYALGLSLFIAVFVVFLTVFIGYGQDVNKGGYYQTVLEIRELNKKRTFTTIDSVWRMEVDRQVVDLEKKSWIIITDTLWKPTEVEGFK
jgi:hypothetical protein